MVDAAAFLQAHGTAAVFAGSALEQFLLPIPSPPLVVGAGAFLIPLEAKPLEALGTLIWRVAIPGGFGAWLGALVFFAAGWLGGRPTVERFGRWFGLTWPKVAAFERKLMKSRRLVLFATRAFPLFPLSAVSGACGALRVSPVDFVLWTLAGSFVRCGLLGWAGYLTRGASLTALAWLHH